MMKLREITFDEFVTGLSLPWNSMMKTHCSNPLLPLILERSMNFPAQFLAFSEEDADIAFCAGNLIGKKFVSSPHFSYGNLIVHPDAVDRSSELFSMMVNHYGFAELRGFQPCSRRIYTEKVSSWLNLSTNSDLQMEFFKNDLIRKIRKAQRAELTHEIIYPSGSESTRQKILQDFYRVYQRNMKKLGSPHLSYEFFNEVFRSWKDSPAYCIVLYHHSLPVGGAINLGFGSFVENNWFATDYDFHSLYPSYLLNWLLIEEAIRQSFSVYSFGRSTEGSGVHKYKKQWGTYDVPLVWSYPESAAENPRKIPDLRSIWRIMPSFATNMLGPIVARKVY